MKQALTRHFNQLWYHKPASAARWLQPLAALAERFTRRKRQRFLDGKVQPFRSSLPVIVVGNLTVGGTGKTPLVIWLVQQLQRHGYRPGIVSRGYGSQPPFHPYQIQSGDSAAVAGDEPLLLFRRTGVPVVIDPQRAQAVQYLQANTDCDVVISDDGLQHYALGRSYEILVLDGKRGLGNGLLLPAGPLRESHRRLQTVNACVINGAANHSSLNPLPHPDTFRLDLEPARWSALHGTATTGAAQLQQRTDWLAVAGIGNPERFFATLEGQGIRFVPAPFPDHHHYRDDDFANGAAILTTEKDAVKLQSLSVQGWYLPVDARLQAGLIDDILAALERFKIRPFHLY